VTQIGEHAVVLGGSLAGLAGAAVLAQRFERVTIVERDCLPPTGRNRKGVPQGRHVHVLLPGGLRGLAELFPGVREDLRERGARVFDARVAAQHRRRQPPARGRRRAVHRLCAVAA
jgi:2-polyprenyl-6-methoxyphenol hydroxylase-like FAD-dependent oxidoreductase